MWMPSLGTRLHLRLTTVYRASPPTQPLDHSPSSASSNSLLPLLLLPLRLLLRRLVIHPSQREDIKRCIKLSFFQIGTPNSPLTAVRALFCEFCFGWNKNFHRDTFLGLIFASPPRVPGLRSRSGPDYLVNRADKKVEGPFSSSGPKRFVQKSRNSCWVFAVTNHALIVVRLCAELLHISL